MSHTQPEIKTCSTLGCKRPATCEISYNYRGEPEVSVDLACDPCAEGYSRRVVLKNFRRTPLEISSPGPHLGWELAEEADTGRRYLAPTRELEG